MGGQRSQRVRLNKYSTVVSKEDICPLNGGKSVESSSNLKLAEQATDGCTYL